MKLTGADCTDADFYEAELVDTDLRNANFSGAYMQGIVFVVVDARKANIFGAVFNPTLNITSTDGAEIITSAAEIARRLGFVDVPPSK